MTKPSEHSVGASELPLVVHFIEGLGPGGAESMLVTNLRHLRGGGFRHLVVTLFAPRSPAYAPEHFWEPAIRDLGIEVVCLGCRTRTSAPRYVPVLARLLRSRRAALVHTHLMMANLVGRVAGAALRLPVVSSQHSLAYEPEALASYKDPDAFKHEVARRVEGWCAHLGDGALVAVGTSVKDSVRRRLGVSEDRVTVIHNPVDLDALDAFGPESRSACLESLGLPPEARLVVHVGRLIPSKCQLDLVHAMERIVDRVPEAHLVLVGAATDAAYAHSLQEAVRRMRLSDRVHAVGVRRDVGRWLKASDVFAFPSTYEGLPVSLAEAAAAGCAIVASDIASNREVLTHEETGLLVPVNDVARLGEALTGLLVDESLRLRLGEAARRYARLRFGPQRSADELQRLYSSLIPG